MGKNMDYVRMCECADVQILLTSEQRCVNVRYGFLISASKIMRVNKTCVYFNKAQLILTIEEAFLHDTELYAWPQKTTIT